ncbi:MAG: Ger(x)C family spore germination protein [Bacillota bacterium]|nr:Ger(x)C family spore germination protein [Bacillota bacterium]
MLMTAVLCLITLFTGCWDKKELNEIAIILALGLDKDRNTNELIFSSQVVNPQALQPEKGSNTFTTDIITTRGKDILDARKEISKKFDRYPFYSHNRVIIISEYLAMNDFRPILDRLVRSNEVRPLDWIIIAKGVSPEELLKVKHGMSQIQAFYLNDIIKQRNQHSEANVTYLQQFVEDFLSDGINPTAGVMEVIPNTPSYSSSAQTPTTGEIKLTGLAVFKKTQLLGYLSDRETTAINFIIGKIKKATFSFPSPTETGKVLSIHINRVRSKINPEKYPDGYTFNIKVDIAGHLGEQQDKSDISLPKTIESLQTALNEAVEKEIRLAVNKLQNDLQADILGFGSAVSRKYPKDWKSIKGHWEDMFPNVKYTLTINSRISRTELLKKTLNIEVK